MTRLRALLLAAGIGSRLRPLTDAIPKCLAPIRGRPLLDHWLDLLCLNEVSEVLVNVHAHARLVESFVRASRWANRITVAREEHLLGTGGTLWHNQDFFVGPDAFLVAHADNLSLFDPSALAHRHATRPRGCEMTMMTFRSSDPRSCGFGDDGFRPCG